MWGLQVYCTTLTLWQVSRMTAFICQVGSSTTPSNTRLTNITPTRSTNKARIMFLLKIITKRFQWTTLISTLHKADQKRRSILIGPSQLCNLYLLALRPGNNMGPSKRKGLCLSNKGFWTIKRGWTIQAWVWWALGIPRILFLGLDKPQVTNSIRPLSTLNRIKHTQESFRTGSVFKILFQVTSSNLLGSAWGPNLSSRGSRKGKGLILTLSLLRSNFQIKFKMIS